MKRNAILPLFPILFASSVLGGCGFAGGGVRQWQEEVVQPDGRSIIVERSQVFDSALNRELSSINAPSTPKSYAISIPLQNGKKARWEAEHSDMMPLALYVSGDAIQIIALPFNCAAYARLGRPVPPFVVFRYDNERWSRTSMDDFPAAITEANLLISTSTYQALEEIDKGAVTARSIKRLNETLIERRIYRQGVNQYLWAGCLRELEAGWYRQEQTK